MKTDGRLGRNFLKGRDGDRINAILAGAGYNYRLVLKWLELLFIRIMAAILYAMRPPLIALLVPSTCNQGSSRTTRYVTFQLAEVAVPRSLSQKFVGLIDDLRRRPVPA